MFGLNEDVKMQVLGRFAARRARPKVVTGDADRAERILTIGNPEKHGEIRMMRHAGEILGVNNPYFKVHEGIAGATSRIAGTEYLNFVSYNYLGLNGDRRVNDAAKAAIDRYGTSVSASRLVAGERPLHNELETALAEIYGAEACITLVSGHATNTSVIGHLMEPGDLLVHDAASHNSILQGAILSGATRVSFPHNDLDALDRLLASMRPQARQALVIVEGHYSMDGDVPDLAELIPIVRRHHAALMVDEAHSLGVLGARGHGIAEHCSVDAREVDIWMGTLSKTLSGCGGYIAGRQSLIDYLKFSAPGFVYSVGLSPPIAAAAIESLAIMRAEPSRVAQLAENGRLFLQLVKAAGLDPGSSIGSAITSVIIGSSIRAAYIADGLFHRGINVQPIIYPAVSERAARLRFFLSSLHTPAQVMTVVTAVAEEYSKTANRTLSLARLAVELARG